MPGHQLRLLLVAALLYFAATSALAEVAVEIVVQDPDSGSQRVVAKGALNNRPQFLLRDSEYFVIDACGTAYEIDFRRQSVIALQPALALQGLEQLSDGRVIYGFFDDGSIYRHALNSSQRGRFDEFRRSVDYRSSSAQVVAVTPSATGGQAYVVDADGSLHYLAISSDRVDLIRPIGPRGGWAQVTGIASLTAYPPQDRSKARHYVVTVDRSGQLLRADLGDQPWGNESVAPEVLAQTELKDVQKLLIDSQTQPPQVLVHSPRGQVMSVDLFSGETKLLRPLDRLAAPAALTFEYWHGATDDKGHRLVYVRSANNNPPEQCPDKRALQAQLEQEKNAQQQVALQAAKVAVKDYEQLDQLLENHLSAFEAIHERRIERVNVENLLASRQLLLSELDQFEIDHERKVATGVEQFQSRWGDGAGGLSEKFRSAADRVDFRWSGAHTELTSLLHSYEAYKVGLAGALLSQASMHKALAESVDKLNVERRKFEYEQSKRYAQLALRFDPDSESGNAIAAQVDQWIGHVDSQNREAIEAAKWPQTYAGFTGPGDPDKLADAALRWTNQKYKTDYFAAYVCGDWYVNQTNLLDEILNYGIAICMVRPDPNDDALGVVSDVTLVTATSRREAAFRIAFFSDVNRISMDKAVNTRSLTASVDLAAGLVDVLLVVTLVGCGLLLAQRRVCARWPQATRISRGIASRSRWFLPLSVAVAVAAAMMLVVDPLSDLLAVLTAMAASTVAWLQYQMPLKALLADSTVGPAAGHGPARTSSISEWMGLAALGMGVLHLLLGWLPLI